METGLFLAYSSLLLFALIPIYFGSWKSVDFILSPRPNSGNALPTLQSRQAGGFQKETFSSSDAYLFPVTGSVALFSLYLIFNYLDKEHVNLLLAVYFAIIGFIAISALLADMVFGIEVYFNLTQYELKLKKKGAINSSEGSCVYKKVNPEDTPDNREEKELSSPLLDQQAKDEVEDKDVLFKLTFTYLTLWTSFLGLLFTLSYFFTKHWILNNFFGVAFSVSAIRLMDVDSFKTGMILLSGLFFYDIFWVFGTDVMVSVAKNFEAPVKLMFPKDIFAEKTQYTMLGLGDIVIPGIFIALCLRFDYHQHLRRITQRGPSRTKSPARKRSRSPSETRKDIHLTQLYSKKFPKPYFKVCFIFYIIGLLTTVVVMHTFKAAQPALLYLSPACILSVLLAGLIRGEIKDVMKYSNEVDRTLKNMICPSSERSEKKADDNDDSVVMSPDRGRQASPTRPVRRRTKGEEGTQ